MKLLTTLQRKASRGFLIIMVMVLSIIPVRGSSEGAVDFQAASNASSPVLSERGMNISLVRKTLARNVHQPVVLQRAGQKLSQLSDGELELVASLARRIAESPSSVAADFAHLLLAALIVIL